AASTAVAAALGLLVAGVLLGPRRGRGTMRMLAVGVMAVPHVIGAASVGLLMSSAGLAPRVLRVSPADWPELVGGTWPVATVVELAWKESAFVALVVVAATSRRHRELAETAAVLGAGPWHRWSRVFVPTAAPALAAASLIVFVYSVGTYEVPWLLGRAHPEPLPVMGYRLFGSIDLAAAEIELVSVIGRETILKEKLESAQHDFDYILLDCPRRSGC
ncbi:MAG: ABC transporter permease subunit, partial [Proteobacteria bacterium]|nr:ABC transporter permease subunit [Pseudomonadota bacterium]